MKRNDWWYLLLILCWTLLFYKQLPGLNVFIFSLPLLGWSWTKRKTAFSKTGWWLVFAGTWISSACVAWYGSAWPVLAFVLSSMLLAAFSAGAASSVFAAGIQSAFALFTSPAFMIIDMLNRAKETGQGENKTPKPIKRILVILLALFVLVFFAMLYASSNVLFSAYADKLLRYLSLSWVFFVVAGVLVLYMFRQFHGLDFLKKYDSEATMNLAPSQEKSPLDYIMSIQTEKFAALVLLVMLNLLLLAVNLLDALFLFGSMQRLPEGVTYSDYVHQGIGTLLFSINLAIFIVLFFFRGRLHFTEGNKTLRWLAFAWMLQNIFLVFSAAVRNAYYIDAYTLTHKRIGIYIYLLLTVFGLATVVWKLWFVKSNAFLFRINGYAFFMTIVLVAVPDWDRIIMHYNLSHKKTPDLVFLFSFNPSSQLELLKPEQDVSDNPDFHSSVFRFVMEEQKKENQFTEWPSLCLCEILAKREIASMPSLPEVQPIALPYSALEETGLPFLTVFANARDLSMKFCTGVNLNDIGHYTELRKLDLTGSSVQNWKGIERLNKLETLTVRGLTQVPYRQIMQLPALRELHTDVLDSALLNQLKQINPQVSIVAQ